MRMLNGLYENELFTRQEIIAKRFTLKVLIDLEFWIRSNPGCQQDFFVNGGVFFRCLCRVI